MEVGNYGGRIMVSRMDSGPRVRMTMTSEQQGTPLPFMIPGSVISPNIWLGEAAPDSLQTGNRSMCVHASEWPPCTLRQTKCKTPTEPGIRTRWPKPFMQAYAALSPHPVIHHATPSTAGPTGQVLDVVDSIDSPATTTTTTLTTRYWVHIPVTVDDT